MEEKLVIIQAEGLPDYFNKVIQLVQDIDIANLGDAGWIREANSNLKQVAGFEKTLFPYELLSLSERPPQKANEMVFRRMVSDVTVEAQRLHEMLRQAAFQAVFEDKISDDLKDRLFSQARALGRSIQELNKRYKNLISANELSKGQAN